MHGRSQTSHVDGTSPIVAAINAKAANDNTKNRSTGLFQMAAIVASLTARRLTYLGGADYVIYNTDITKSLDKDMEMSINLSLSLLHLHNWGSV